MIDIGRRGRRRDGGHSDTRPHGDAIFQDRGHGDAPHADGRARIGRGDRIRKVRIPGIPRGPFGDDQPHGDAGPNPPPHGDAGPNPPPHGDAGPNPPPHGDAPGRPGIEHAIRELEALIAQREDVLVKEVQLRLNEVVAQVWRALETLSGRLAGLEKSAPAAATSRARGRRA